MNIPRKKTSKAPKPKIKNLRICGKPEAKRLQTSLNPLNGLMVKTKQSAKNVKIIRAFVVKNQAKRQNLKLKICETVAKNSSGEQKRQKSNVESLRKHHAKRHYATNNKICASVANPNKANAS